MFAILTHNKVTSLPVTLNKTQNFQICEEIKEFKLKENL